MRSRYRLYVNNKDYIWFRSFITGKELKDLAPIGGNIYVTRFLEEKIKEAPVESNEAISLNRTPYFWSDYEHDPETGKEKLLSLDFEESNVAKGESVNTLLEPQVFKSIRTDFIKEKR